jgi:hypothetical protein
LKGKSRLRAYEFLSGTIVTTNAGPGAGDQFVLPLRLRTYTRADGTENPSVREIEVTSTTDARGHDAARRRHFESAQQDGV